MKIASVIFTVLVTSCFYFPFEFSFLPGINTKMMLAVIGLIIMGYHMTRMRTVGVSKEILLSSLIAILFSLISFFSVDYNNSQDYAYATYIASMWAWLTASYTTCALISVVHKKITVRLVVDYLIAVCLMQCALALIIDFVPAVKMFVDSYFTIGITDFLNEVDRLYGIGAALDVAGIRFSAVLIMIAILLSTDNRIRNNSKEISLYIVSFLLIAAVGNMISRTTSVGMIIGVLYLIITNNLLQANIRLSNIRVWKVIVVSTVLFLAIAVYLYSTNRDMYVLIRFGFEGFFNWAETGEWRTDSTDRLNTVMWIWPEYNDIKTWLIGKAVFSNWHDVGTDIGYCRFIFYCGTIGLSVFILFFAYLSNALWIKFSQFKHFFLLLFALLIAIWLKVSTDVFLVYALFLSMGSPYLYEHYFKKPDES